MLEKILNSDFIKGNKVYGLHINHESDGTTIFRAVLLYKEKDKIEFEEKELKFESLEAFTEKCDKNIPLVLTFDSKQVLSKKATIVEEKRDIEYLLPNASEDDFYTQEWILNDTEKYIAAVRKDILNPIFQSLKDQGFMILNVYLGAFAIKNIIGISDDFKNQFYAYNYQINVLDNIAEVKKIKEPQYESYSLGEEFITSEFIIAFASGIDFFIEETNQSINILAAEKENFLYKQLFIKSGWAILIIMFLVLLINYMFYMRYDSKRNELNSMYTQNIGLISRLDTLRKEITFKESFLGDKGFLSKSITSYYADRIAASVPKSIVLTDLNVYPLEKQMKANEAIYFNIRELNLKGTYLRSTVLNQWIVELESYDWTDNVEIKSLLQEKITDPGEFELMLSIK